MNISSEHAQKNNLPYIAGFAGFLLTAFGLICAGFLPEAYFFGVSAVAAGIIVMAAAGFKLVRPSRRGQ